MINASNRTAAGLAAEKDTQCQGEAVGMRGRIRCRMEFFSDSTKYKVMRNGAKGTDSSRFLSAENFGCLLKFMEYRTWAWIGVVWYIPVLLYCQQYRQGLSYSSSFICLSHLDFSVVFYTLVLRSSCCLSILRHPVLNISKFTVWPVHHRYLRVH